MQPGAIANLLNATPTDTKSAYAGPMMYATSDHPRRRVGAGSTTTSFLHSDETDSANVVLQASAGGAMEWVVVHAHDAAAVDMVLDDQLGATQLRRMDLTVNRIPDNPRWSSNRFLEPADIEKLRAAGGSPFAAPSHVTCTCASLFVQWLMKLALVLVQASRCLS